MLPPGVLKNYSFYLALKGRTLATLNVQFWGKPKKKKVYNGDKILQ